MPVAVTNGIETYYEEQGSGEPLLFIHGAFGDCQMWQHQVDHFSQHYRVITYDVRGHGDTGHSDEVQYSIALMAKDLNALCERLDIQSAAICGLSMGGLIAQQFAVSYPGRVSRLALCSTLAASQINPERMSFREVMLQKWLESSCRRLLSPEQFVSWLRLAIQPTADDPRSRSRLLIRRYIEQQIKKMSSDEFAKLLKAFLAFKLLPLEQIRIPALVMVGQHEYRPFHHHSRCLHQRIPNAVETVIPNAGHMINLEEPDTFNQALAAFLGQPPEVWRIKCSPDASGPTNDRIYRLK